MSKLSLLIEILNTYRKFDWRLRRLLLRPETLNELKQSDFDFRQLELPNDAIETAEIDAMWFARLSPHNHNEAWELRLLAAERFALFETFESDEAEEDREDVRREMQARLRNRTLKIKDGDDDCELSDELALDE